jgi:hypothetical protein
MLALLSLAGALLVAMTLAARASSWPEARISGRSLSRF